MKIEVDSFIENYSNSTKGINDAITYLYNNGGGTLVFKSNKIYRSGMIKLLDNIELYFEKNSMLKASDNLSDFNYLDNSELKVVDIPTYKDCSYNGAPTKFFIYGKDLNNIKISGEGIIDGNEEIFYGVQNDHHIDGKFYPRIPLIFLENCNNFEINKINIQRSGFWTIHLIGCNNGLIDSISIKNNRKFACTDGIDPDHSKNIIIRNCYIESADDCVVFKSTENNMKYGDTKNIKVYNCIFKSTSAAIKFGSETCGDIHDIEIKDINILDTNRGISFQLRDKGNIYNISFDNINMETKRFHPLEWWGKGEPINICAVRRKEEINTGYIKNVNISNINIISENSIFIYGENNIYDINLKNINMELKRITNFEGGNYDLRPYFKSNDYLVKAKTPGIYIKGADNINIDNYKLKIDDNFMDLFGKELYINDVSNLKIDGEYNE